MRKIYYIANARMPTEKAHGIQLAKMCEAFIEEGIDLELVVPDRKTSQVSLKDFYGLRVDIPIKKLPVVDWYARGRVGFLLGSLSFVFGYFFYLLAKRLRGETFIVYMVDIDQFSFFLIPFVGVPYFCEIHDAKQKCFLLVLLFRFASGIIVINSIIKKELQRIFGIPAQKIIVHPNGIDMSMFALLPPRQEARKKLGIDVDRPMVLYVGRFYEWKGLDTALNAASLLKGSCVWYFVGGTSSELMHASGMNSLPGSVQCMGHHTFTEIPMWLAAADILLMLGTKKNKYSYLHTSPMKCFEYMASKRSIIASATPANREIIGDSEALLYEPDNSQDLAEKIHYALAHRDEMNARADCTFAKAQSFSWDKRSKHISEFIMQRI